MNRIVLVLTLLLLILPGQSNADDGFVAFGYSYNGAEFYAVTAEGEVYLLSTSGGVFTSYRYTIPASAQFVGAYKGLGTLYFFTSAGELFQIGKSAYSLADQFTSGDSPLVDVFDEKWLEADGDLWDKATGNYIGNFGPQVVNTENASLGHVKSVFR